MTQHQEAQQKFLLLLQQLELTDDVYMSFFENGELSRVTVHKKIASGAFRSSYKICCRFSFISSYARVWPKSLLQLPK